VNDAEDGGVDADAECEGQDDDEREPALALQGAYGVTGVAREIA
jgi:hypothetical protein